MVAASLVRRKQLMASGMPDPYAMKPPASNALPGSGLSPASTVRSSDPIWIHPYLRAPYSLPIRFVIESSKYCPRSNNLY